MEKTTLLAQKLKSRARSLPHLKHLTLKKGEMFSWSHTACAITYNPTQAEAASYLLHEFGHAVLNHTSYLRDIELLQMERDAWSEAQTIATTYDITIDTDIVQDALDSYRDWLHSRSLCPACSATGIQYEEYRYRCLACATTWKVNEARTCALRRYSR